MSIMFNGLLTTIASFDRAPGRNHNVDVMLMHWVGPE